MKKKKIRHVAISTTAGNIPAQHVDLIHLDVLFTPMSEEPKCL